MHGGIASRDIGPAESETLRMREHSMFENREIPAVPAQRPGKGAFHTETRCGGSWPMAGRSGKACGHNPDVHAVGKSDTSVVPENAGNKAPTCGAAGQGGTVNPLRDRKSGAGNPPPAAGGEARNGKRRTGGREGW